jgi:YD repeat-containing protein
MTVAVVLLLPAMSAPSYAMKLRSGVPTTAVNGAVVAFAGHAPAVQFAPASISQSTVPGATRSVGAPNSAPAPTAAPAVRAARGLTLPTDIPADPRAFSRKHPPLPRLTMPPMVHLTTRPSASVRRSHTAGTRMQGPPVDLPARHIVDRKQNTGAIVQRFMASHPGASQSSQTRSALNRAPGIRGAAQSRTVSSVDINALNATGINHWWSYEEGDIPGVGRWMVNARYQNLIIQSDDMDIHHRGIDLAFRRTYNSFSNHDFAGTDGATEIGQYGNGWTNTFDAHLSTNNCLYNGYQWSGFNGFSVHDIDGGRYDYCFNSAGQLVAPPGMQGTSLTADPGGGAFYWTKKSGTTYMFYAPYYGGTSAAYSGRIYRIWGRNSYNYIQFSYGWTTDASSSANLTNIYATTDNGMQAVLTFDWFNGKKLLSQLRRPDGATITYGYDGSGNLATVDRPAPNNSGTPVRHWYGGYHSNLTVSNGRWNATYNASANAGTEGGYVAFSQGGLNNAQTQAISFAGVMNFAPDDATGPYLQPGAPTGVMQYRYVGIGSAPTYMSFWDTDGHSVVQYIDGTGPTDHGNPTVRWEYTGSQWLSTSEGWDSNNNLVNSTDARGNRTDYAYDIDGNTVAVAAPPPTPSAFRPTSLYSYDLHDNIEAYCDPVATHALGADWVAQPVSPVPGQGGLCPKQSTAATRYQWLSTTGEPFGELTSMTSPGTPAAPNGYQQTIAYEWQRQGGTDYGLPTGVSGAAITELDGTTITPAQSFWYDANGNLRCYSKGNGSWTLQYDALARLVSAADPDDRSANGASVCGKTTGGAGWNTQTTTTYYLDGSVQSTQTPAERAAGVATAFTYDVDGNPKSETHHFTCTASCTGATTRKWYDGAGRLVEVALPRDGWDYNYSFDWLTRYIYDLSAGQGVSVEGQPATGYGNLVKTQEWNIAPGAGAPSWLDMKGNSFDGLDRPVKKFAHQPGTGIATVATMVYDGDAQHLALLTSTTNPEQDTATYTYDAGGKVTHVAFTSGGHPTPDRTYGYDANGRRTSESSPAFGTKYSQYDARGLLTTVQEASGGNVSFPSTISYDYYANGARKAVSVGTTSNLITYSYRADGARTAVAMNYSGRTFPFTFAYTDGGRMTSRTDPFTNTVIPNASPPVTPGSRYAPQSWGYDATGQLASLGMPYAYAYNGVSHDAEGHMLGWHINLPTYGDVQTAFTNSVRGENVGSTLSTSANGQISMSRVKLLHGAPVPSTRYTAPDFIDSYNGIVTSQTGYSQHDPYGDGLVTRDCPSPNYVRDTYDRAGRMTMHDYAAYDSTPIDCQQISPATGTTTYAYDADDHTVLINGKCVGWGPDGHALTFSNFACGQSGSGQSVDTAHYDGDSILFVTTRDINGTHYSARLEQLGTMIVSSSGVSFTVGERDMSGNTVGWHNDTGYQGRAFGTRVWTVSVGQPRGGLFDGGAQTTYQNQYSVAISGSGSGNGTFSVDPQGSNLWYDASDGFTFEGKRFQGVRVMDPETGHWTSPDAYAGEVHDPMSQKPFMWNRNNPYAYSDPSGYYWESIKGISAEALYIAFSSPTFRDAWNAIAASERPFSLVGNDAGRFNNEKPGVVGVTDSDVGRDAWGGVGVMRSVAYIRPGMGFADTASTIMHEVGAHQYFAIKDPKRELDLSGKYEAFRENRAYAKERLQAIEANILGAFEAVRRGELKDLPGSFATGKV